MAFGWEKAEVSSRKENNRKNVDQSSRGQGSEWRQMTMDLAGQESGRGLLIFLHDWEGMD